MKRTTNPDIVKLNIITVVVLLLSSTLAYLIWNGYIRFLDKAFCMRRESCLSDTMINVGIIILMAGVIEYLGWKIIKAFS